MKYVYILLETVARELNANLLLAIGLLDSGFTPIILSQLALRDNLANLPKGIILDKGYGLSHIEAFKNYKKKGFKVAVLRSEPIVYNKRLFDISHASGVSSLEWVDKFFSIGENYNNDVTHGGPVSLDSHITGNPRFNLFANEEFRFLFDRLKYSNSKIRSGKDYILIVGNFSDVNEIPDRNKEGVFPTLGLNYDSLYSNASSLLEISNVIKLYRNDVFISFLNMIEKLCSEFPQMDIIYRPHPSENYTRMSRVLNKHRNFYIIYSETAASWILGSIVSIQNNCTTAIEAFLLNKPQISYRKISSELIDNQETLFTSKSIKDLDYLMDFIKNQINSNYPVLDENEINEGKIQLKSFISNIDKDLSIISIINELNKIAFENNKLIKLTSRIVKIQIKFFYFLKRYIAYKLFNNLINQQIQDFNLINLNKILSMMNSKGIGSFEYVFRELNTEIFILEVRN